MKLEQTPPIASDVMKIKELEQTVASQEKTLAETEAHTRILEVYTKRFSTLTNLRRK